MVCVWLRFRTCGAASTEAVLSFSCPGNVSCRVASVWLQDTWMAEIKAVMGWARPLVCAYVLNV